MYILRPSYQNSIRLHKKISDYEYSNLSSSDKICYERESDFAPSINDVSDDYNPSPSDTSTGYVFDTTDYSTPSAPVDDTPSFSGFGGGDFGGGGSSSSWGDSSSNSDSGSYSSDSGSSYDSGSSSDSSSSSSDY